MAVVNMPIECLVPHPGNPRKDLGNLEELTASIKENGIYQNLTVIPVNEAVSGEEPKYMVVIGHRRLEAAKRAGLMEVPCAIVRGLTETQQLQIMLLENMQRNDLTFYEQAQGFQQLLDFGMDIEEISQQSGFSKRTIRRRLEIAKLDQDKLKKISSNRQLNLKDFDALARIENIEARNEAMEKIGTNDFALAVSRAVDKEALDAAMPVFLADMERLGIKKFPDNANKYSSKYRRIGTIDLYRYEETKKLLPKKTAGVYYEAGYPRNVEFYVKETKKAKIQEKSAKEIEKEKCIKEAWAKMDAMAATHYELRKAFIENFEVGIRQREAMLMGAYSVAVLKSIAYIRSNDISKIAGIDDMVFDSQRDEKAIKLALNGYSDIQQCLDVIYKLFGDSGKEVYSNNYHDVHPKYKINPKLEVLYHWLGTLGYKMSSEEKLLATGQHEVFKQKGI